MADKLSIRADSKKTDHQQPQQHVINLGLCGFGRAGKIHFTTIRKSHRCKLKYIVDLSTQKTAIEEYLQQYNYTGTTVVSSEEYESVVLSDSEVDGIIVTSPTYAHEENVCKALKHKKGVFCEKPVAESLDGVSNCYDAAAKAGVPLFCAFNRRFDDAFCSVKEQAVSGAVGKIHSIRTISRDAKFSSLEYFQNSPGIFHDSSVHDIDLICWILNEDPIELYAQGHAHHPGIASIPDIDTAAIVMKFPSGVVAMIDQSRHSSYGYDQRLEVFGDKGILKADNISETSITLGTSEGITNPPYIRPFATRYAEAYYNEMMHFLDVLEDPSIPVKVSKEDAERATRLAAACNASYKSKKAEILG